MTSTLYDEKHFYKRWRRVTVKGGQTPLGTRWAVVQFNVGRSRFEIEVARFR